MILSVAVLESFLVPLSAGRYLDKLQISRH